MSSFVALEPYTTYKFMGYRADRCGVIDIYNLKVGDTITTNKYGNIRIGREIMRGDAGDWQEVRSGRIPEEKTPDDNGASAYYTIPKHATDLKHLISERDMSFTRGNIFKACYRLGNKPGVDAEYDIKKIIYFANELMEMHKRGERI